MILVVILLSTIAPVVGAPIMGYAKLKANVQADFRILKASFMS